MRLQAVGDRLTAERIMLHQSRADMAAQLARLKAIQASAPPCRNTHALAGLGKIEIVIFGHVFVYMTYAETLRHLPLLRDYITSTSSVKRSCYSWSLQANYEMLRTLAA